MSKRKSTGSSSGSRKVAKLSDGPEPYQSRCWMFTVNNYLESEVAALKEAAYRYLKFGRENCPTTGTPHLQGFVVFENAKTRGGVLEWSGTLRSAPGVKPKVYQMSCRPMYSSVAACQEYCGKDGDVFEKGDPPVDQRSNGQSAQERTLDIIRLAKAGAWNELEEVYPDAWFYQQRQIMTQRYKAISTNESLDGVLDNVWIFGPPRVGKSRLAREMVPGAYIKPADTRWWDGYNGEDNVVLDDLSRGFYAPTFKTWTDRHAFICEVKCGTLKIRPKRIVVTSNHPPEFYFDKDEDMAAIYGRFQIIQVSEGRAIRFPRVHTAEAPPLVFEDASAPYQP